MDLKNTKTYENLMTALAGESIARNKYCFFADVAREQGNEAIAIAFEQMARNEMMHAKFWFEYLYGIPQEIPECLTNAARGEYAEWHGMYPDFAETAREEGLDELAEQFEKVSRIEKGHEFRFMTLLSQLSRGELEKLEAEQELEKKPVKKTGWRCQWCGATYEERPDSCPTCKAIGSFDHVDYYE